MLNRARNGRVDCDARNNLLAGVVEIAVVVEVDPAVNDAHSVADGELDGGLLSRNEPGEPEAVGEEDLSFVFVVGRCPGVVVVESADRNGQVVIRFRGTQPGTVDDQRVAKDGRRTGELVGSRTRQGSVAVVDHLDVTHVVFHLAVPGQSVEGKGCVAAEPEAKVGLAGLCVLGHQEVNGSGAVGIWGDQAHVDIAVGVDHGTIAPLNRVAGLPAFGAVAQAPIIDPAFQVGWLAGDKVRHHDVDGGPFAWYQGHTRNIEAVFIVVVGIGNQTGFQRAAADLLGVDESQQVVDGSHARFEGHRQCVRTVPDGAGGIAGVGHVLEDDVHTVDRT